MAQPTGIHARRAALRLLDAVLRRGETLDVAFGAATKDLRKFEDKALARAIASEVLRWLVDLDEMIDSATKKPLPDDAKARMVLRMMLAQWLRLDTPPHAVIATCLPLLAGGPRRLAHGVFSTLTKSEASLNDAPSLPDEVAARWGERASAIAAGLAEPPPLDLTLKDPAQTEVWKAKLAADSLMPGHLRLARGENIEKLAGFASGEWWVQDLAASLPARLLGAGEGRHVLDLCAAPGGKTMQLAAQGWQVTALDISKRRLDLLKANLKRTDLKAGAVRADALQWEPRHQFDAILLDAPCTATGTARRHPDVIHRIGSRQIEEMAELQAALLERAASWLKPGGVLVYATCSLESEEGEAQEFPEPLSAEPIGTGELPEGLLPSADGTLRTDPGMLPESGGIDGFFIARMHKRA
ncbi:RsmB/NOP family class I SAM-dependent RNA methyltransferase [Qipengyuania sphaerica]|uniref:RsmB/NOP family class I SAM-dependent RNA methyltransferase n=1 Tax=Qipengyuania sphaerica TaxID=2867243 RepID=UPI001C86CC6C|nr:RsmB/NOP family class I SAM-dependent RNA methyltransferase [Qipengyuania sphaerica]MBX7539755.1 RsmB/NOP family class I SAM-dependent RNA methyltransferase [Qipengyuania sphaerica]